MSTYFSVFSIKTTLHFNYRRPHSQYMLYPLAIETNWSDASILSEHCVTKKNEINFFHFTLHCHWLSNGMQKRSNRALFQVRRGNYFNQLMNAIPASSSTENHSHADRIKKLQRVFQVLDQEQSMVKY